MTKKVLIIFASLIPISVFAFTRSSTVRNLDRPPISTDADDFVEEAPPVQQAPQNNRRTSLPVMTVEDLPRRPGDPLPDTPYNRSMRLSTQAGSCGTIPANVTGAFNEAKNFSNSCETARLAPGKMIAINDYSAENGRPFMYIFDQAGNCVTRIEVAGGQGRGRRTNRVVPCSSAESQRTPPGMHMTARHIGGSRYNERNSLGLAGLCGQDSLGVRGILIHGASYSSIDGSWGCSTVPQRSFQEIREILGVGSLVYNFFGNAPPPSSCRNQAGFEHLCRPEAAAIRTQAEVSGQRATPGYEASPAARPSNRTGTGR